MNTQPHLDYREFLLLRDLVGGGGPTGANPASYIDCLLSLQYIRPVEGKYVVTRLGRKRLKNGS